MMDIGNLFKNHVSLNGEEMDKRENFLIKSFILVFCLSFSSSIVLSILFNFFIGLFAEILQIFHLYCHFITLFGKNDRFFPS